MTQPARHLMVTMLAVILVITALVLPRTQAAPPVPGSAGNPEEPDIMRGGIAGSVFFDHNGNGMRDPGENGIAGIEITLRDTATGGQIFNATARTAADGTYRFAMLSQSIYTARVTTPQPYVGTTPDSQDVAVGSVVVSDIDFGIALPITFIGTIYNDLNNDGVRGLWEPAISDALVEVYNDANTNGQLDPDEARLAYTFSDLQGNFAIYGLKPGNRVLCIQVPGGADAQREPMMLFSYEAGSNTISDSYGLTISGSAIIGVVYRDLDGDGVRDANELGLPGASVRAIDLATGGAAYNVVTITDGNGAFQFAGLNAGTYRVTATIPSGFISTTANQQDVTVTDVPVTGINFGAAVLRTVSGTVFQDANNDGYHGLGEAPILGATVEVYDDVNANGLIDPGEGILGQASTDHQGNYAIHNIKPGPRVVHVQLPGGAGDLWDPLLLISADAQGGATLDFAVPPRSAGGARLRAASLRDQAVSQPGQRPTEPAGASTPTRDAYAADMVIVRFHADIPEADAQAILTAYGLQVERRIPRFNLYVTRTLPGRADAMVATLSRLPQVKYAERDGSAHAALMPSDPDFNNPNKVYAPQKINAPAAWDITIGSPGIIVAVVDTGISLTHPEFAGRIVPCVGICDFVNSDSDPSDDHGHGTHVAGIVAAAINNQGMVGIAPNVRILPVKVLNSSGWGYWSQIASGIIYAVDQGARIINLSLGGITHSGALIEAVQYAAAHDVLMVAAAGAQRARPATLAFVLGADVPAREEVLALRSIDALTDVAQRVGVGIGEAVAG